VVLGDLDIHVWHVNLDQLWGSPSASLGVLSTDERDRAERFCLDLDRRRFIAGRGALRAVLGGYLEIAAPEVQFSYGPKGKPFLSQPNGTDITFNLSHTAGLALIAVGHGGRLGVDVERTRPIDAAAIVERYFTGTERRDFWAVAPEQRLLAFLSGWTRKEAVGKALGDGLGAALDQVEVSMMPGEPAFIRRVGDGTDPREWSIWDVSPQPGTVGAIAAHGRGLNLSRWILADS
jgi:4'-phosphopantetheinyl transferase